VVGKSVFGTVQLPVALSSMVKNNVNDLIVVAYVFGRLRHDFIDDFTEKANIALPITAYTGNKSGT
jgi:hypothetical protein